MNKIVRSNEIRITDWGTSVLRCPRCNGNNLHQRTVTVFDRGEDQEQVVRTTVEGNTTTVDVVGNEGNPSSRRHGLSILFDCERCGNSNETYYIELTVAQHKGSTETAWRYTSEANPESHYE